MASLTRVLPLLLALFLVAGPAHSLPQTSSRSSAPAPTAPDDALGPTTPHSADEALLVATTIERFTTASLTPPENMVISFHTELRQCGGDLAMSSNEAGHARLRVCWSHDDAGLRTRLQEQALVHEMAHAWVDANVTDTVRNEFVSLTGSDSWREPHTAWEDRGTERAAELITWAVLDPPVLFIDTDAVPCEQWADAYELLTAQPATDALLRCR